MFCSKCGHELIKDSEFCKYCGRKTDSTDSITDKFTSTKIREFITLNCPSCGGKLKILPNSETLVCNYCGAEHLVRRAVTGVTLETFARCPTCGRNDKSVKVTIKFGYPTEPTCELIGHERSSCGSTILLLLGLNSIGSVIFFTIMKNEIDPEIFRPEIFWSVVLFNIFLAGLFLFLSIFPRAKKNHEIDKTNIKLIQDNNNQKAAYQNNLRVWEKLYYCERDDTFFSLNDHISISKENIRKLFPYWGGIDNFPNINSFQ